MTPKRKLLGLIKNALETEEKLVPIYANHCRFFSDCLEFESAMRERFSKVFAQLRDDSRRHRDMLANLVKTIEEEL